MGDDLPFGHFGPCVGAGHRSGTRGVMSGRGSPRRSPLGMRSRLGANRDGCASAGAIVTAVALTPSPGSLHVRTDQGNQGAKSEASLALRRVGYDQRPTCATAPSGREMTTNVPVLGASGIATLQ